MNLFVPVKHKQPASKVLGRLTLFGLCLVVLYLIPASHVLAVETPPEDAQGGVVSDGSESSTESSSEGNSTEGNGDGGENKGTEEAGGAEDAGDAEVDPMQDLKREAAARQKAASLPRVHLNPQAMSESFLAEQQKAHKQVWLQTDAEDGRFLALLEKERSGQPQGAVILVPGLSEHSAWPQLIDPLREELPDQGWYTIAISMPSQDHLRPPERELPVKKYDRYPGPKPDESEADENGNAEAEVPEGDDKAASEGGESAQEEGAEQTNPEPVEDQAANPKSDENGAGPSENVSIDLTGGGAENDDKAESDEKTESAEREPPPETEMTAADKALFFSHEEVLAVAISRIGAAIEYARSQGYQNLVLLGVGDGVEAILTYVKSVAAGSGSRNAGAMIWLEADLPDDGGALMLEALGENWRAPLLDLLDKQNASTLEAGRYRKGVALRSGFSGYQQVSITLTNAMRVRDKGMLVNRIAGWLKRNAPGIRARTRR